MTENNSYTIETDNKEEKEEEEEGTSRKMTFQRLPLTRVFKILVTLTSIVTLLYIIKYRHCSTEIHSSNYETRLSDRFTKERYKKDGLLKNEDRHVKRKSTHFTYNEAKRRFRKYWVLHRDLRTNYRKILSPCQLYMTWKPHYPFKGPYTITSANNSFITLDIQPAGQFSTLNIDTYTLKNTRKRIGGDSWRIHVQGVTSVPVIVVDHNNGSYEASFLITEAGSYTISIHLDYTLCDGFKDPPPEWFIKGNAQGKYQPNSALPGYERPFLEDKFAYPLSFEVKRGNTSIFQHYKKNIHEFYDPKPCFSWDGFGQWFDDQTWKPYIPTPYKYKTDLNRTTGRGVFWVYGDSIGDFLYRSISKTALCSEVFNDCRRTYNWIYNIPNGNLKIATEENDDKDFNITRIESELLAVLNNEELDYSSAILLNYGLHFVQDIPFDRFKNMITRVIDILTDYMKRPNHAKVIWKTTTALQKWKYGHPSTNARHNVGIRFLTSQRVELFNALSTSRMCEAGIDVIDVYPMTYAFPNGTGSRKKFWDAVHYEPVVFKTLEEYINNFFNIGNYL